ncbi:probable G-protein coupled receptor 141 [Salmo salar]|uniref:Probable G-protein coupled receptor 141 n=1 Tax=Salmo salar TaxID=8030 RepID=A0A1S3NBJ4_SALSA|nr:probable G-protein coupled receptor 141 [Salmo salar]|eukprot:XP_014012635.1 PREDICTED: probable G-protein coupled receptor 141 [Salmo salar]
MPWHSQKRPDTHTTLVSFSVESFYLIHQKRSWRLMVPSNSKMSDKMESLSVFKSLTLVSIYSLVLVIGIIGLALMIHILQSNMRSVITIAMLNLTLAHFLFLITVPFRIYYYAAGYWGLGMMLCKVVSAMIHVHMYMAFIFYVVILVIRLLGFHSKKDHYEFYRKLHAFGASVAVWLLVFTVIPPILHFKYGMDVHDNTTNNKTSKMSNNDSHCFQFGNHLEEHFGVKVLNYIMSSVIIIVACVLTALQCHVMVLLTRKYGRDCMSHQEFWAQLKSLCFALVLLVCFVPYHVFRMYYLGHLYLENTNEVFLSLTALSCFDMLTFLGRGHCYMCNRAWTV